MQPKSSNSKYDFEVRLKFFVSWDNSIEIIQNIAIGTFEKGELDTNDCWKLIGGSSTPVYTTQPRFLLKMS